MKTTGPIAATRSRTVIPTVPTEPSTSPSYAPLHWFHGDARRGAGDSPHRGGSRARDGHRRPRTPLRGGGRELDGEDHVQLDLDGLPGGPAHRPGHRG